MTRFPCTAALLTLTLILTTATLANAQDKRKQAATDPAKADGDFAFQGEFFGSLLDGSGCSIGMQLIAGGDGKFDAVLLKRGLPGMGWERLTKRTISGQRKGNVLNLADGTLRIAVRPHEATIRGKGNRLLAHLQKIHRASPTLGACPPHGATVLFDGRSGKHFDRTKITPDGLLMAGTTTKMTVGDFRLHLEFRTPYMPHARGQQRGNSGVYIQRRYEVQILDSFGLDGVANECGGLYRQRRPDVNMCLPPLAWQSYDIYFTAARFADDGKTKISNARITVLHNGVAIHDNVEITNKTGAGRPEGPQPMPIHLQDHGNPVQYRNIWIVTGGPADCR